MENSGKQNVLALESQLGDSPGDFEIVCQVIENNLPSGYHSARETVRTVTIAGSVRVMDERFQKDLADCMHLKSVLARELIEEVVIPRIDLGDPPPAWVERTLGEIQSEVEQRAHQARFLAHFVEAADPELAATLRHLAGGAIALVHAINVAAVPEADQTI